MSEIEVKIVINLPLDDDVEAIELTREEAEQLYRQLGNMLYPPIKLDGPFTFNTGFGLLNGKDVVR